MLFAEMPGFDLKSVRVSNRQMGKCQSDEEKKTGDPVVSVEERHPDQTFDMVWHLVILIIRANLKNAIS